MAERSVLAPQHARRLQVATTVGEGGVRLATLADGSEAPVVLATARDLTAAGFSHLEEGVCDLVLLVTSSVHASVRCSYWRDYFILYSSAR